MLEHVATKLIIGSQSSVFLGGLLERWGLLERRGGLRERRRMGVRERRRIGVRERRRMGVRGRLRMGVRERLRRGLRERRLIGERYRGIGERLLWEKDGGVRRKERLLAGEMARKFFCSLYGITTCMDTSCPSIQPPFMNFMAFSASLWDS